MPDLEKDGTGTACPDNKCATLSAKNSGARARSLGREETSHWRKGFSALALTVPEAHPMPGRENTLWG